MKLLNKMKTQKQSQAGFTFIEVIIAIAVLSFGVLGLITTTHTVSVNQRNADDATEATMVATDELENIKRLATNEPLGGIYGFRYVVNTQPAGFLNPTDFPTSPNDYTRSKVETNAQDPSIPVGFTKTTTVAVYPSTGPGDVTGTENFTTPDTTDDIHMVEATVEVAWSNHTGSTKSVQLSTILQRRQIIQ